MNFVLSEGAPAKIESFSDNGVTYVHINADFEGKIPQRFTLTWKFPAVGCYSVWSPSLREGHSLQPNWSMRSAQSRLASWMPLYEIISADGRNRLCIALSDVLHPMTIRSGVCEFDAEIDCCVEFFTGPTAPMEKYDVVLRLDTRDIPYEDSVRSVVSWWESECGYKPADVPPAAREPVNSLWYSMHHGLDADEIVHQCALSTEYGMKVVIIDDGWQMDRVNGVSGVYAQCGDWVPSVKKMGDMRELSERIHKTGMKVVLWYSVPFVGIESELYGKFSDMLLDESGDRKTYFCLDPRYPEVREHLASTYESAVRDWGLDGLKLDFIDAFGLRGKSLEYDARRDCTSIEEALDRLMSEVCGRLTALRPDILLEFRQTYVGPAIRRYGNMLRAADCPMDAIKNRIDTAQLRLTSGATPVHSDMLMWNISDSAENAAVQLASVLFSVPQVSMLLDRLPEAHLRMLRFYLDFWRRHRETLLDGELRARHPESGYSAVSSRLGDEMITVCYTDPLVRLETANAVAVNAGLLDSLIICGGSGFNFAVSDCMGEIINKGRLSSDTEELSVPRGGMIKLCTHSLSVEPF